MTCVRRAARDAGGWRGVGEISGAAPAHEVCQFFTSTRDAAASFAHASIAFLSMPLPVGPAKVGCRHGGRSRGGSYALRPDSGHGWRGVRGRCAPLTKSRTVPSMSMCLGDGRCRGDGGAPGGGGGAPKPLWGGRRTPTITPLPLLPRVPSVPSESRFALPAIDFALLVSDGRERGEARGDASAAAGADAAAAALLCATSDARLEFPRDSRLMVGVVADGGGAATTRVGGGLSAVAVQ